jgi:hypothetical protein
MTEHLHATLARSVECWSFHEDMLEQGKQLLREKLLDACVTQAQTRNEPALAPIPPHLLGHLDTVSVLLSSDLMLRKQIMFVLRRTLSVRQMCLLLIVQVCISYYITARQKPDAIAKPTAHNSLVLA